MINKFNGCTFNSGVCLIHSTQSMKSMIFTSCEFILDRPSLQNMSQTTNNKTSYYFLKPLLTQTREYLNWLAKVLWIRWHWK